MTAQVVVLDTNIVLDLFVFDEPQVQPLREALQSAQVRWLSTAAMREELRRVLDYPQIAPRVAFYGLTPDAVLAQFDRWSECVAPADKAPFVCKDPDDQRFIDLAVAHGAQLISKDKAVLTMNRRMQRLGAESRRVFVPAAQALVAPVL